MKKQIESDFLICVRDNVIGLTDEGKKQSSLVLPNGIIRIGLSAFKHAPNLVSVTLPSSLKVIDYSAFENCFSLTSVKIPDISHHTLDIYEYAFWNCVSLDHIKIPATAKYCANTFSSWTDVERYAK